MRGGQCFEKSILELLARPFPCDDTLGWSDPIRIVGTEGPRRVPFIPSASPLSLALNPQAEMPLNLLVMESQ